LVERESEKIFAKIALFCRARSFFFATSPKDDIILTIKNHPSSSVSSLCSQ